MLQRFPIPRSPFPSLRARIDDWILARVPRSRAPVVVSRRRVYILPTRFGLGFAGLVLVLLLGAMNYGNSMAFALCFLLAGLVLVTMHHTHANLVGLRLRMLGATPVFAGDEAQFIVMLDNLSRTPRCSLSVNWRESDAAPSPRMDVGAEASATLPLALRTAQRGRRRAGAFRLSSEFPLGLFRAWTWADFDAEVLVYPAPAPPGRALPTHGGEGGVEVTQALGSDEFSGLRDYQRGDSARAIHWKSLPRIQRPMVKQFADSSDHESWLDWDALTPLDAEARLSQLTRWVLELDGLQRRYGLRLPDRTITPDQGATQRAQCLQALALFGR